MALLPLAWPKKGRYIGPRLDAPKLGTGLLVGEPGPRKRFHKGSQPFPQADAWSNIGPDIGPMHSLRS